MASYKKLERYAMEQYGKLPQEGNELYANHFVNIPFELDKYIDAKADAGVERKELEALLNGEMKDLKVRFDAVLGSGIHFSKNSYVRIKSPEELDEDDIRTRMHDSSDDKYMAFIDAYAKSFVYIDVPDGKNAKLNLLFSNSSTPSNAQIIINVGNGSKLNMSELYCSRATNVSSSGVIHEVKIGRNSTVELNSLHNENGSTVVLNFCRAVVGEASAFGFNALYNGGSHVRTRNKVEAKSPRSRIGINEIVLGSGEQKFDINTLITNTGKETDASLTSKAVLMDSSLCMMKGFAKIEKGAVKSRSYVHQRGMALDKGAKVYELPDMSVEENDVKATHSSAMSPVDSEAMFYLMSKGIDEREVRKLLVTGFFADSLSRIEDYNAREIAMSLIREKLKDKTFGKTPKVDTADMWVARGGSSRPDMFDGHYKYEKQ